MAKLYGKNSAVDFAAANLMSFGKSFSRLNGQPLDKSEIWYDDLQALQDYALTDAAYVGQRVVYIDSAKNTVTNYCIQTDGTLEAIGTSPIGDEKSIVVAEDGTISLNGISGLTFTEKNEEGEDVEIKYQPLMTSAGLTWVRPSATTVEGLASEIESLKTDVTTLKTAVGNEESGLVKEVADNKAKITTLIGEDANKSVRAIANEELAAQLIPENAGESLDTLLEIAAWIQKHPNDASAMNQAIDALEKQMVGIDADEGAVKAYIDSVIENYTAVTDFNDLAGRVTTAEGKLKDIEDGAQVNLINSVDEAQFAVDGEGKLTLLDIAMEKVDGLDTALAGKADKGTTLAAYGIGDAFTKTEVENELAKKVAVEAGKSLVDDNLVSKLSELEAGAQVNKLEAVKLGETVLEIVASDKSVVIPIGAGLKASEEVTIADDGTLGIGSLNVNKLAQTEGEELILNGGSSAV